MKNIVLLSAVLFLGLSAQGQNLDIEQAELDTMIQTVKEKLVVDRPCQLGSEQFFALGSDESARLVFGETPSLKENLFWFTGNELMAIFLHDGGKPTVGKMPLGKRKMCPLFSVQNDLERIQCLLTWEVVDGKAYVGFYSEQRTLQDIKRESSAAYLAFQLKRPSDFVSTVKENFNDKVVQTENRSVRNPEAEETGLTPEQREILSYFSIVEIPVDDSGNTAKAIRISGINIQIVNGLGATSGAPESAGAYSGKVNGVGNLIIGYQEPRDGSENIRTGSHNLIVGQEHNYSSFGGFVAGCANTISHVFASVAGGQGTSSGGGYSLVSGGEDNETPAGGSTASQQRLP